MFSGMAVARVRAVVFRYLMNLSDFCGIHGLDSG